MTFVLHNSLPDIYPDFPDVLLLTQLLVLSQDNSAIYFQSHPVQSYNHGFLLESHFYRYTRYFHLVNNALNLPSYTSGHFFLSAFLLHFGKDLR